MNVKRILAMALAFAVVMSCSLSVFASEAKVYFFEDFSSYNTVAEFAAKATGYGRNTTIADGVSKILASAGNFTVMHKDYRTETLNSGKFLTTFNTPSGGYKYTTMATDGKFVVNSNGDKAFAPWGNGDSAGIDDLWIQFLSDEWATADANNAVIGSVDIEFKGKGHGTKTYLTFNENTAWALAHERTSDGHLFFSRGGTWGSTNDTVDNTNPDNPVTYWDITADGTTLTDAGVVTLAHRLTRTNESYAFIDGTAVAKSAAQSAKVGGFQFTLFPAMAEEISFTNIKIFSISTATDSFYVEDAAEKVATSATSVKVKFSQPVIKATLNPSAVVVTENGERLTYGTDFTVSGAKDEVSGDDIYSYVTVNFNKALVKDATYEVKFSNSGIKNANRKDLADATGTFQVEGDPFAIGAFSAVKDMSTAISSLVADGSVQGVKLTVQNKSAAPVDVTAVYAVYASNGSLADVVYVSNSIATGGNTELGAGVKLTQAGTVKAFVWDGNMAPFKAATELAVAAQ